MAPIKTLPFSRESERALLSACILRPAIIPQVRASGIRAGDFYVSSHSLIWEALCDLGDRAEPAALAQWARDRGLLEQIGGEPYLMELADYVSTSAGWAYHVGVIRDKATRRAIIKACSEAGQGAYGIDEPGQILSDLKSRVRDLNAVHGDRDCGELVRAVWSDIERRSEAGERYIGVRTGFGVIDSKVYGLEPKTTIYLIARPSVGKTALGLNISDHMPNTTLFFSLESTGEAITRRRLAARSGIPLWRIRTANLDDDQYRTLTEVSKELVTSPLRILDAPAYKTIEDMCACCESAAMDGPLSLIVVDHIQRMRTRKKLQNRHLELSWISEELSTLSKNLNVPILILCQLNREIEKRPTKSKYPQLFDIRESGDLEANADQVWGLWRADKESPDCRLECLKGRDTGTWVSWLKFDMDVQRFMDSNEPTENRVPDKNYMDK